MVHSSQQDDLELVEFKSGELRHRRGKEQGLKAAERSPLCDKPRYEYRQAQIVI